MKATGEGTLSWGGRWRRRTLRWLVALPLLAVAPFVVLIRVGVTAYQEWGLGTWPALALGVLATAVLLGVYAWLLMWKLGAGKGLRRSLARVAMLLAAVYAGHTLLYVASRNVKNDGVRSEYRSLHPLLRVASGTIILIDREVMITDAGRTIEDYVRMGLPPNEASLHIARDGGSVHALDLRTRGRPAWRNWAIERFFRVMGFRTLRHVGTADHLHVSLPPPAG